MINISTIIRGRHSYILKNTVTGTSRAGNPKKKRRNTHNGALQAATAPFVATAMSTSRLKQKIKIVAHSQDDGLCKKNKAAAVVNGYVILDTLAQLPNLHSDCPNEACETTYVPLE